ncbi:hypothetical protein PMALA_042040 [Plasmodium malariae]|uniref:Uncharacterized protein n=1 Tax=Plasmodium malariae TaxID=5858 RepID=A0A1A8WP86_PLAMA|nr:hypothetical protein PMALA_042040 [Plasmodium malariae]
MLSLETESRNLIIFLYNFEEKWLCYVIGIKEDFQSNYYDVFSNWIDDERMELFKPHVLDYILSSFERFNENIFFYNKIVASKLMNSNEKKHEWDYHPYRLYEVNC